LFNPDAFPKVGTVWLKWAEVEKEQTEFVNCLTNGALEKMLPIRKTQVKLGAPDATPVESFHLPSRSSRTDDAAAWRRASGFHVFLVEGRHLHD
jgi:hypothetical protein